MMILKTMSNIDKIWLEQESVSGKNVLRQKLSNITGLNCYIGLVQVTGARMFQLELGVSPAVSANYLKKFRGVEIQIIPHNDGLHVYTIILLDRDLTDVFTMFIEDIIEKLVPVSHPIQALSLINQRVSYWKKLFSKAIGSLLSAEQQRGLYGELVILKLLLQKFNQHQEVLLSWRGSESSNQDFARNGTAVEVKTTQAINPTVHIANELQLDYTAWENLFIVLLLVTESTGRENSLTAIIDEIRAMLNYDPELIRELEVKLDRAGIHPDMTEYYNEKSYTVNSRRYFHVKDGFPVITRSNLQSDLIYNVKYQIDISAFRTFETSEESTITHLIQN